MNIKRNMDSQGEDTGEAEGAGRGGEVGPTPEEEGKEEDRLAELYKVRWGQGNERGREWERGVNGQGQVVGDRASCR
jgi:hypothetical protein